MRVIAVVAALAVLGSPMRAAAQGDPSVSSAEPFKLGTFEVAGEPRIGIVLRDAIVVELAAANRALERDPAYPAVPMPATMVDLIGQYEYGMKVRLYEIVNTMVRGNRLAGMQRPPWVHDVKGVDILPPLMPGTPASSGVSNRGSRK